MDQDGEGFQMVQRKGRNRGRKARSGQARAARNTEQCADEGVDTEYILRRLRECQSDLQGTNFLQSLKERLSKHVDEGTELVCYGVGSFATCLIARYQLSLFFIMRDHLKVGRDQCLIYDPVLSEAEKEIIRENNCTIIEHNEEGKHIIQQMSIFYMPHCGKALYNNLLWANWNPQSLSRMTIIGNSFQEMFNSTPERILKKEASYVLSILPFSKEEVVKNDFQFTDIFNNTSIHTFPEESLLKAPSNMWTEAQMPMYDEDVEIICNKES